MQIKRIKLVYIQYGGISIKHNEGYNVTNALKQFVMNILCFATSRYLMMTVRFYFIAFGRLYSSSELIILICCEVLDLLLS